MLIRPTRSGLELDVLLQSSHGLIGIEIKARKAVASKDFKVTATYSLGPSVCQYGTLRVFTTFTRRILIQEELTDYSYSGK